MKLKLTTRFTMATLALMTFTACRNDEPVAPPAPRGDYENGILVANEGNFGTPNASISFIPNDLSRIDNDQYTRVNGEKLGDVLQDVGVNGEEAWLVLNNSNKIVIVNRFTMKKITTLTGFTQPRYIAFAGGNAYITEQKAVTVVRVSDRAIIKKIDLGTTAEKIKTIGERVYVQNAAYGSGKKITVINTRDFSVSEPLEMPFDINDMETSGSTLFVIGDDNTHSYLVRMTGSSTAINPVQLPGLKNAKNLEVDASDLYFSNGSSVYKMAQNANVAPTKELFTTPDASWSTFYGFNLVNGKIFTSNANGFKQAATITVYSTTGSVLKTFDAGMGTNGFYQN